MTAGMWHVTENVHTVMSVNYDWQA